jgi:hypothetical protein
MTMGLKDDGDPPTGNPGVVEDSVEDYMDPEETTEPVVRKLVEKSGSNSPQKDVVELSTSTRNTSTMTTTSMNGQSTGVDARFGSVEIAMDLEETTVPVVRKSVKKSGSNLLQKDVVELSTSTRNTRTMTTMSMNGQSTGVDARFGSVEIAMDLEEATVPVVRKSVEKSGSRKSSSRFAHTSTSTSSK